jgi:hypothetical protein
VELPGGRVVGAEEVALFAAGADHEADRVVVGRESGVRRVVRPVGDTHAVVLDGVVTGLDRGAVVATDALLVAAGEPAFSVEVEHPDEGQRRPAEETLALKGEVALERLRRAMGRGLHLVGGVLGDGSNHTDSEVGKDGDADERGSESLHLLPLRPPAVRARGPTYVSGPGCGTPGSASCRWPWPGDW